MSFARFLDSFCQGPIILPWRLGGLLVWLPWTKRKRGDSKILRSSEPCGVSGEHVELQEKLVYNSTQFSAWDCVSHVAEKGKFSRWSCCLNVIFNFPTLAPIEISCKGLSKGTLNKKGWEAGTSARFADWRERIMCSVLKGQRKWPLPCSACRKTGLDHFVLVLRWSRWTAMCKWKRRSHIM